MTSIPTDDTDSTRDVKTVRTSWSRFDHPSTAIVQSVATAIGEEPTALSPLHYHVDVDALDGILTSTTRDDVSISFAYADVRVTVEAGGDIWLRMPVAVSNT